MQHGVRTPWLPGLEGRAGSGGCEGEGLRAGQGQPSNHGSGYLSLAWAGV